MSGLSINNLNSGNVAYAGYSAQSNDNNSMKNNSPVSKMEPIEVLTAPEPFDVPEPIEFDNPFENPFDFSAFDNPFDVAMPDDINNPFSIEMPIEISTAEIPDFNGGQSNGKALTVMEPYTLEDGGTSKSALSGKKVTPEELSHKYKCSTCESRKYKDVSSDPGVSFQVPTKVSKESARSAVAAHEQQHVARNQDKADREGREVVSQTVTYHSNVCPECGDTYISGGTTETVTREKQESPAVAEQRKKMMEEMSFSFEI